MKRNKNGKKKGSKKETQLKDKISAAVIKGSSILFGSAVLGLIIFSYFLLHNSDYFFIKRSEVKWLARSYTGRAYKDLIDVGSGENMIKFDARTAADKILTDYPELKDVRIIKRFPDKLILNIKARVAVAQVGDWSFYLIDKEGVTLTEIRNEIREGLPIITGAKWRLLHKIGNRDGSLRMKRAVALLKIIGDSGFLNDHMLTKLDISDHRNIAFYIEHGLEIKIGHSNFAERLKQLQRTLSSMVVDKDQIKYIDLRFDDVILGTK